jgi:hypothetical protein
MNEAPRVSNRTSVHDRSTTPTLNEEGEVPMNYESTPATSLMKLDDEMLSAIAGGCGHHGRGRGRRGGHDRSFRQSIDQSVKFGDITVGDNSTVTITVTQTANNSNS